MDVEFDTASNPGPGAYQVSEAFNRTVYAAPRATLGSRFREYSLESKPGPGEYDPDVNVMKKLPVANIRFRPAQRIAKQASQTPGPANYSPREDFCSTRRSAPRFTLSGRPDDHVGKSYTPGPGSYCTEKYTWTGPRVSLGSRHVNLTQRWLESVPGAGTYDADARILTKSIAQISLGGRHYAPEKHDTPGPGAYNVRDDFCKPAAPAMSLSSRVHRGQFLRPRARSVSGTMARSGTGSWAGGSMRLSQLQ